MFQRQYWHINRSLSKRYNENWPITEVDNRLNRHFICYIWVSLQLLFQNFYSCYVIVFIDINRRFNYDKQYNVEFYLLYSGDE